MINQKGSAILIVMMMMGILALLAAGMIIQSRMDSKLVKSRVTQNQTLAVADGATRISFYAVKNMTADNFTYSGGVQRSFYKEGAVKDVAGNTQAAGFWDCYRTLVDAGEDTSSTPAGWELGSRGMSQQCWVAEGTGSRATAWDTSGDAHARKSFNTGDLVAYRGSTYQAVASVSFGDATTPDSDSTKWTPVAPNPTIIYAPVRKMVPR